MVVATVEHISSLLPDRAPVTSGLASVWPKALEDDINVVGCFMSYVLQAAGAGLVSLAAAVTIHVDFFVSRE